MRRPLRAAFTISLMLLAGGGEGALAAAPKGLLKPPTRPRVPPLSAKAAGLRGEQLAPLPVAILRPAFAPSLAWPPRPALARLGQGEQSFAGPSLVGLQMRTDAAPICRSTCASFRYRCLSADNGDSCDSNWTRCVLSCRDLGRS